MIYNITNHPELSGKSIELVQADPAKFDQQALLAEQLLNIPTTLKTGRDAELLKLAVALQVNFQLLYNVEPQVLDTRTSTVERAMTRYKTNAPMIDPRAQQLVNDVLGVDQGTLARYGAGVRSVRGPNV